MGRDLPQLACCPLGQGLA